jgi:hypothetical protein
MVDLTEKPLGHISIIVNYATGIGENSMRIPPISRSKNTPADNHHRFEQETVGRRAITATQV